MIRPGYPLRLIAFVLLTVFVRLSFAQNITETQWFFGNGEANMQFDKNGLMVYEEDRMNPQFGTGGPAVISDQFNGNLLFYSDGERLYDASHQLIVNSTALNGNSNVNQAAVACQIPGNVGAYLIFTNPGNSGVNEIQYTEINAAISGNGNGFEPLGTIRTANNSTGLTDPSEAMIILESRLQQTYWLVTQSRTTLDFQVTIINPMGVGSTQTFNLDVTLQYPGAEAAQFAYHADSALLAVAPKAINRNIALLNFNDTTGALTFNRVIRNTGFDDGQGESVYDVEWSNDGTKLFLSRFGASDTLVGNVYHVDLADSLEPVLPVLPAPIHRSYGLRRAIDGRIYHLYQEVDNGPFLVGRFDDIDSVANGVQYEAPYFDTDFNGRQFPTFAPRDMEQFNEVGFRYLDSCQMDQTKFFPEVEPLPNNYFWDFGDGNASNATAPIHEYDQPGTYLVTLIAELNGQLGVHQQAVRIEANDLEVDLGADTVICINEELELDAGMDGIFYQWSTGATSQTITVDTAGTYWVEVTAPTGCTSFDAIEVTEYGVNNSIGNQWYFGEMAGIDFNVQPPEPLADDNLMFSAEGCATISDSNGDLLFYTNGSTVWNKDHQVMPVLDTATHMDLEPHQIGGDSTLSQGVMILPFMDDETMFYIFTAQETYKDVEYDMRYSIVDIKKDTARGGILLRNMPLFDKSTEKVTASGFTLSSWLVTHEFGNNNYRVNFIDQRGISATVHSPVGEVIVGQESVQASGTLKFNPGGQLFAHVVPGTNNLEILDFVDSSGRMAEPILIETGESELYGMEWSPDGSKIYVTTSTRLIQFDLDSLNSQNPSQDILDSKFRGYTTGSGFGALQRGSNGVIYLAVDGSNSLYTITAPNGNDADAGFTPNGQDLAGRTSRLGLPNFTQQSSNPPQAPGFTFEPGCLGQQSLFFATGTSQIDEFLWTFDTTATNVNEAGANVATVFSQTGQHPIELNIFNRCGYDTLFFDTLDVFSIPESPQIPSEANLCTESLELEAWFEDRSDLSYYWSTGDTSRTITITEPNIIDVAIINSDGCSSDTASVFVGENRPFLDLGNDRSHCEDERGIRLDAGASGVTFDWFVDGEPTGTPDTSRFQTVSTTDPGLYEYSLTITEPFFNCTRSDTVQVLIQESPGVSTFAREPSNCGTLDASIEFDINTSGSFTYSISGQGLAQSGSIDGPGNSPLFSDLGAGNYQLFVENLVSGCTTFDPITIEDLAPFEVSASNLPDCDIDANLTIAVTGARLPDRVNLYITDVIGDTIFSQNNLIAPIRTFPQLDSGLYFVQVEDFLTNCIQADTVLIEPVFPGETDCEPLIVAPNAFSPNGNGFNEEFFIIPNAFVEEFEIFVYSRWGELVFYSTDQNFRWGGDFNGKILGPGTFAYVMKFINRESPELGQRAQYGSVTIVK